MDVILGHDSEEVRRVRAWKQSASDAMRSMVVVVTRHPQTCEHDMVMIQGLEMVRVRIQTSTSREDVGGSGWW